MARHTMYTFQLHRKGVILLVVLALAFSVLVFLAGYLARGGRGGERVASPTATTEPGAAAAGTAEAGPPTAESGAAAPQAGASPPVVKPPIPAVPAGPPPAGAVPKAGAAAAPGVAGAAVPPGQPADAGSAATGPSAAGDGAAGDTEPTAGGEMAAPARAFTLRLDTYLSREDAYARARELVAAGYAAGVTPLRTRHGQEVYQVLVGEYPTRAAALEMAESIFERERERAVIIEGSAPPPPPEPTPPADPSAQTAPTPR